MSGTELKRTKELEGTIIKLEWIVARQAVELEAARDIIQGKY